MEKINYIHKAGGVLIQDKKLLVTRTRGKDFFVAPGGKLEVGETVTDALIRELKEELSITTHYDVFYKLDTYYATATGEKDTKLQMEVFIIEDWDGEITPGAEVEEIRWIDSNTMSQIELGSIFKHEVMPELKRRGIVS